ncbi:M81 family metallopeptidase [Pseudomonas sp. PDM27]|uniref:M81 family metallopeptidase n=1 Tax=Pseudomonas sp. PDM27 TaxID=2854769 RepID=UPI001C444BA4|nr:M81 family metallopeptidase [Pseudomonas sp. PDM27]MBV7565784.1 M81 family metallopeptidase [Pseudomonas sp. PDM27]
MTYRILIAGFQHETNTFAPSKAEYENFVRGEGFPQMVRGSDLLELRNVNIPLGGFLIEADRLGYEVVPVIWAGASPSAHVTEETYERITKEIINAAASEAIDGLYLDLHGAMVAEHTDDGEGTLLARLRAVVGEDIPIVASLDLHANVTESMLKHADAMVAFRTYPHVDMADTGARAARLLDLRLRSGKLHCESLRLPFLIPINGMCTLLDPARSFYEQLEHLESDGVSLSFTPGFPAADFEECGPVIWGYGIDRQVLKEAVSILYEKVVGEEDQWEVPFLLPDEAVLRAMALAENAQRPIVIADTQDNPGAGGDSNTTGMLKALIKHGATNAAVGLICDPAAVHSAIAAGIGGFVEISLGGQSGAPGDSPLQGRFEVMHLSDGRCRFAGPMMNGMEVDVGPVACLKIGGVKVAVSSGKCQMLDRNLYRLAGIQPEQMSVLVNKSSVHFRADFAPIAEQILVAKAPGPMTADPADIPWKRLRAGIRLKPNGPSFRI